MPRDDANLLDVVQACRLAIRFADGMDKSAFLADLKTQSAVLHQLLVLGEAVKRMSQDFRNQHPEVPWRPIAGMRDRSSTATMKLTLMKSGGQSLSICQS